jgi:hypothetical protein
MAYADLYNTLVADVGNHILWRRAFVAVLKAASDIRNEDAGTSNHANRLLWAQAVEQDPASAVMEMRYRIMENATIQAAPTEATDNDVQFVVNLLVDSFATG